MGFPSRGGKDSRASLKRRVIASGELLAPLTPLLLTFFAIFYVNYAYLASRDAEFLQRALDLLVSLFERVGLETNVSKAQTMICTPGRIRT